jgi:hypothetical protein
MKEKQSFKGINEDEKEDDENSAKIKYQKGNYWLMKELYK